MLHLVVNHVVHLVVNHVVNLVVDNGMDRVVLHVVNQIVDKTALGLVSGEIGEFPSTLKLSTSELIS